MFYKLICVTLFGIFYTPAFSQNAWSKQLLKKADSLISEFFSHFKTVPGIAVAVVNESGPIFMKGYGWADKEKGIKTDENTLFYIASSTKSFTALAAALLDKEKKILLDSSFKKYLPGIKFKNAISDSITIRNLLTHTSGLVNPILTYRLAYTGDIKETEILKVFSDLTETKDKTRSYAYDNLGYNIYAIMLKQYLNLDWREVLKQKIFDPLKMDNTTAYISLAEKKTKNIAVPYAAFGRNGLERIELTKTDNNMQSAGGLVSSVSDLSKWLMMEINKGRVGDKQIIPADVIAATQTGYANNVKGSFPFTATGQYGLGWQINDYQGQKIIHHFGGYPGFKSHMSFMPEKKLGVAILVNEGTIGSGFSDILSTYIYDYLLGVEDLQNKYASLIDEFEKRSAQITERNQQHFKELADRKWQLSLPLVSYTGKYTNEYIGELEVYIVNDTLAVKMGNLKCISSPYKEKETIRVELIPGEGRVIAFKIDENKKVTAIVYDGAEYMRNAK